MKKILINEVTKANTKEKKNKFGGRSVSHNWDYNSQYKSSGFRW